MSTALPADISVTVSHALAEDIGEGDLSAALVPERAQAQGHVISRQEAVLCGSAWFDEVFRQVDEAIRVHWQVQDGETVHKDQVLCRLEGPAHGLLTGERSALNFLQSLSGTATEERRYAEAVKGTRATILDTRKTLPGLRNAQKYAMRCGGANNHRMGLYDGILIKENHLMAAGGIAPAVQAARRCQRRWRPWSNCARRSRLARTSCCWITSTWRGCAKLEASGSIDLKTLRQVAETGVDYISVDSLTKHVQAVDLSMRFEFGKT